MKLAAAHRKRASQTNPGGGTQHPPTPKVAASAKNPPALGGHKPAATHHQYDSQHALGGGTHNDPTPSSAASAKPDTVWGTNFADTHRHPVSQTRRGVGEPTPPTSQVSVDSQ